MKNDTNEKIQKILESYGINECDLILKEIKDVTTEEELRILKNYISRMPKTYRARNDNAVIVHDILLSMTSTSGRTSCIEKCYEIGIDPYSHSLERKKDE